MDPEWTRELIREWTRECSGHGAGKAKGPNTVWVLSREKVGLGVVLSCYIVLGSRVVLYCVVVKIERILGILGLGEVWGGSWRPHVAIPQFGVGLGRSGRWVL